MKRLFLPILILLTTPALAGITVRETSAEPWRYECTVTNDTADQTMWAVCMEAWGGSEWMTDNAVLSADNLPINWRLDPLEDYSWRYIVVWSSVVGSDLSAGGVMTFDLVADRPLTMLEYTLQYSEGLNVAGVWAVPEPETGLLACAGIGVLAYRRRRPERDFQRIPDTTVTASSADTVEV